MAMFLPVLSSSSVSIALLLVIKCLIHINLESVGMTRLKPVYMADSESMSIVFRFLLLELHASISFAKRYNIFLYFIKCSMIHRRLTGFSPIFGFTILLFQ